MAVGLEIPGSDVTIKVATTTGPVAGVYTPGTYSPLSLVTGITPNHNRTKNTKSVFMDTNQKVTYGPGDHAWTVNVLASKDDSGQAILNTARDDNSVVALQVHFDGATDTDGFVAFCRVGTGGGNWVPDDLLAASYELSAVLPPTADGAGPIL